MSSLKGKITTIEIKGKLQSGARGKSAYELWLELGNSGTIEDFLDSIGADKTYTHLQPVPQEE